MLGKRLLEGVKAMSEHSRLKDQWFKAETHCFYQNGDWFTLDVLRMLVFKLSFLESEILGLPNEKIGVLNNGGSELSRRFSSAEVTQALGNLEKKQLLQHTPEHRLPAMRRVSSEINELQLNIAQDCNLRCKYCAVEQGSFGGPRVRMSSEVGLAAVDFLLNESKDSETVSFVFTGGEPLLNFSTIKAVVEYAQKEAESRGKTADFLIATNGTLFNDKIFSFIKENKIKVQVSLDGDKETHDKMRVFPNGRGSYNVIKKWLPQLLADYAENVRLRATLTPETHDFVASFKHLRECGTASITLRHASGIEAGFGFAQDDCEQFKDSYSQLAQLFLEEVLRGKTSLKGPFMRYILTLCTGHPRSHYCGAATNMLGVSASGKLYPCGDLAEVESYELGDAWGGVDWRKLNYWRDKFGDIDLISTCQNCWARYLCGGGCIAAAIKMNGNPWQPNLPDCVLSRHIIELSVWLYAELRRLNPKVFLQLFPTNLGKV
jgi:uncharacterized protein